MVATRLRLLSLLTAAVVVFGACSNTAAPSGSAAASGSGAASACAGTGTAGGATELQIPDVVAGKFNVAMVLIGPHDDGGWSQAHYEGLQYVCENVPDAHVAYIELVPEGADSEQVFRSLSRKGFNLIIGTSFGYMDPMAPVAEEFPDITYLHLTGFKSNGTNFGNFFGAMEDFKYLAGMLAGSRAKKDGNPKLGYMATFPIPEELRLGNAIMLGVKQTCPECTMDVRFINTWHDPVKESDAAASLFDAGAQVVFTGADTPGRRRRRAGEGQVGRHLRPPRLVQGRALPDRAVLDLGSGVRPHRRAGQGQDLQGRLRVLRRRRQGDGPVRLHGRPDADQGRRRPAGGRRQQVKDTLAKMLAGEFSRFDVFAGPIKDNTGKEILAGRRQARAARPRPVPARARPAASARSACTGGPRGSPPSCRRPGQLGRSGPAGVRPWAPSTLPRCRHRDVTARPVPALETRGIVKRSPASSPTTRSTSTCGGRDPRAAGRERGRQEHADEHPGRALPAGRGPDPARRAAGRFRSPRDAIAAGLGMVHQHFTLVPSQTVTENILLGLDQPRFRLRPRASRTPRSPGWPTSSACGSTRGRRSGSSRSASSSGSRSSRCSTAAPGS